MISDLKVKMATVVSKGDSKPTGVKYLIGLWIEGVRIFARLMWFSFNLGLLMAPLHLMRFLISPKQDAVFYNGNFDPSAGTVFSLMLLYLPFACVMAVRISRQLEGPIK